MGQIHPSIVSTVHLTEEERSLLRPFLSEFSVSWAKRYEKFNAKILSLILKPEPHISETFGIESEICLFISEYKELQDRTFQAAFAFLYEQPAFGRVDQSLIFLVCGDPRSHEKAERYLIRNPSAKIPVVFSFDEIGGIGTGSWDVRNRIAKQLFTRDLFDYQLPLDSDLYFFGRDSLVQEYVDAIRKGENRGLFGLRKTGKTSLLLKVKRVCESSGVSDVFYYDCKLPAIRELGWRELLERIIGDMESRYKRKFKRRQHIADSFVEAISKSGKKICIFFDEIEYISPLTNMDFHWRSDFISFWQTMWSVQSQIRTLSFVLTGVNADVVERAQFSEVQNPVFGIVRPFFLRGLELDDSRKMIRTFGKRMGLRFSEDSIRYLYNRYGGHPLLIRMACSFTHKLNDPFAGNRPIDIEKGALERKESERDRDIMPYCRYIVSEIRQFYPDEYEVLSTLALGQVGDAWEYGRDPYLVMHIQAYGLISSSDGVPRFLVPVLGAYVRDERLRETGGKGKLGLIPDPQRAEWVRIRASRIVAGHRALEAALSTQGKPEIWKGQQLPEVENFIVLQPVYTKVVLDNFLLVLYRNFVEPVFIKGSFKRLSTENMDALIGACEAIRCFRHFVGHLELVAQVKNRVEELLQEIVGLRDLPDDPKSIFAIQQYLLDNLFVAFQSELQKLI